MINPKNSLKKYFFDESPLGLMESYAQSAEPIFNAQILVRIYYFFLLYTSIVLISSWDFTLAPQTFISSIWSIAWLQYVSFPLGMTIIRLAFILAGIFAVAAPQYRLVRIFSFVTFLEFVSLYYSVLQLDVDWYTMLLTSFLLIFLPHRWEKADTMPVIERQKYLLVFWGCQAIVALTYTMAGIGKIVGGTTQFLAGESFVLEPKAAALQIANRLILTDSTSLLGHWAMSHYLFIWPFFVGTIYVLLCSFLAVFRPKLHRVWGFLLILFHITNYLFINIGFSAHIFLLALLFLASPFAPGSVSFKEIVQDMPILGLVLKGFTKRHV